MEASKRFLELVAGDVLEAARGLLGWTLLVDGVGGQIVEVEAYREDDEASHSFGGRRGRNTVMFGPPGDVYVYRSYGLHWCMNVVCEESGRGAAVLLRALEPTHGLDRMRERRGITDVRTLCAGPGRLTQALGVDGSFNALSLAGAPFQLIPPAETRSVAVTPRVGLSKAVEKPWRYVVSGSTWTSRGPRQG